MDVRLMVRIPKDDGLAGESQYTLSLGEGEGASETNTLIDIYGLL